MLKTFIEGDRLHIGERFSVSFQRTLRLPDDGTNYPLPPGLGLFPLHRVEDFPDRATDFMKERGGVFTPMHQQEALWLGFNAAEWKPNAVKVGVGQVNAISGDAWDDQLHGQPQDYIICPNQLWLDGINAGEGYIRQFVAMPLGLGYTVEAQITGREVWGGIQIIVFEPKLGRFPDTPPEKPKVDFHTYAMMDVAAETGEPMGLGVGGRMTQKIYPDPYGIETWDQDHFGSVFVHIVNSEQYYNLTQRLPPPTPVSAGTYVEFGLPWFELYDEDESDIPPPEKLSAVVSIEEKNVGGKLPDVDNKGRLEITPPHLLGIKRAKKWKI
ncbi:MAG: hypothetical protein LC803_09725 [Acidobacteria bacterium]|nr:hypothetical protein [Acidobacteriota bacterium]